LYATPVANHDAYSNRRILYGWPSDRITLEAFKHQCAQSKGQSSEHKKPP
jgi:hypothetical protein